MKPLIFLLFLILSFTANSQIVNIPDPNFKNALLNHEILGGEVIDTNEDGEIQFSEAEAVTELYVGDGFVNMGIEDITGIEAFINITKLDCINNNITILDLTYNISLIDLSCSLNPIVSINLSNCISIEKINAYQTHIDSINLSANFNLKSLNLSSTSCG